MADLIRITPDLERAKAINKMVDTTLLMIQEIDKTKFASHVTKEYYDAVRELMNIILLLDGYKITGDKAHKELIDYIRTNYELPEHDITLVDNLRITRNKIAYDGFFVPQDYIERTEPKIKNIVEILKSLVNNKLNRQD